MSVSEAALDGVFHALSHATRRAILRRVTRRPHSISELAKPFDVSLEAVSQHIRVLEGAGLLKRTRIGRVHRVAFEPAPLRRAAKVLTMLAQFWDERLDGLDSYLRTQGRDA